MAAPGARVVRVGDYLGVVAEKEWDAIQAAKRLKVTWSEPKAPFPPARIRQALSSGQA